MTQAAARNTPPRLLITSSYYWPEEAGSAPYVTGMAEHLATRGFEVSVSTAFPHYPSWTLPADARLAARERREGVDIRRRWAYVPARQSPRHRLAYEASLLALGATALGASRPDAVLGFIPSLAAGTLAALAGRRHRRPYGLVIHDLVGPGAEQSGLAGGNLSRAVSHAELAVARGAAGIAVIAEGFRSYFEGPGSVPPDRIVRVRTWTRRTAPTYGRDETRRQEGWEESDFVCLHAGNMGRKQALDNVLDAARLLAGTNVRLVLVGDGNDRARLQARARAMNLPNLAFRDFAGPGLYESLLGAADLLVLNQAAAVGDMSLPSKLTSYFASSQPVIAAIAATSETAREIRAAEAGLVVPPGDPEALARGILQLRDDGALARSLGAAGLRFAHEVLSPDVILRGYEAFARRLLQHDGDGGHAVVRPRVAAAARATRKSSE